MSETSNNETSENAVKVLLAILRPYLQHAGDCGHRWKVGDFVMPCTCGLEGLIENLYEPKK
jgi:hypothetical protein